MKMRFTFTMCIIIIVCCGAAVLRNNHEMRVRMYVCVCVSEHLYVYICVCVCAHSRACDQYSQPPLLLSSRNIVKHANYAPQLFCEIRRVRACLPRDWGSQSIAARVRGCARPHVHRTEKITSWVRVPHARTGRIIFVLCLRLGFGFG